MKISLNKENVTLKNVKNSDYWALLAIIIWGHYSEEKYQDESKVSFTEKYYGKGYTGIKSFSSLWDDPSYNKEGFTRTLRSIRIKFERSDYNTYIHIPVDTEEVLYYGMYLDRSEDKSSPRFGTNKNLRITNWMLDNGFYQI